MTELTIAAPWSPLKKNLFFFALIFICLNCFPFTVLLDLIDGPLLNRIAGSVFGMQVPVSEKESGSGDTSWQYLQLFATFCFTLVLLPVFFFVFRKRQSFNALQYWFTVYIRYYLATMMMAYGFAKLFGQQFSEPDLDQLLQSYGSMSPMGLAWRFMGHSKLYCVFTGIAEVAGGFLLFFRKTMLLGAMIVFGVMMNVMMMNYAYDIPVKLFSTQLVLIAAYLMVPDAKRIISFFFLAKTAPPPDYYVPDHKSKKRNRIAYYTLKSGYIGVVSCLGLIQGILNQMEINSTPPAPLSGIYHVVSFTRNGVPVPPLATDTTRWKTLVISRWPGYGSIRFYNDSIKTVQLNVDTLKKKIGFELRSDEAVIKLHDLSYVRSKDNLILKDVKFMDTLEIRLRRFDERNFRLLSRGFHWISEEPYNR